VVVLSAPETRFCSGETQIGVAHRTPGPIARIREDGLRSRRSVQRVGQVSPGCNDVRVGRIEEFEQIDQSGPDPGAVLA